MNGATRRETDNPRLAQPGCAPPSPPCGCLGFTLLETMFSMVVVLIAGLALLQGIEVTILQYKTSEARWETILNRWNEIETLRSTPPQEQDPLQIIPGARPLFRQRVGGLNADEPKPWEVFRASK